MKTILLVEDEAEIAHVLRDALELHGYRVILAYDGQNALEKLTLERIDLVLTDIMMPILDGNTLISRIRSDPATQDLPIVVMSATENVKHRPFLKKPFQLRELIETLEKALASAGG